MGGGGAGLCRAGSVMVQGPAATMRSVVHCVGSMAAPDRRKSVQTAWVTRLTTSRSSAAPVLVDWSRGSAGHGTSCYCGTALCVCVCVALRFSCSTLKSSSFM